MSTIKQILIIGHTLHTHTHSYVFNGIYRALKYLGHSVEWIGTDEEINLIKNNNKHYDIIITEIYHNKNIPIIKDCIYIIQQPFLEQFYSVKQTLKKYYYESKHLWNVDNFPYYITDNDMHRVLKDILPNNIILWRPYLADNSNYISTFKEDKYRVIVTPWATDLLPEEIDKNIENLSKFSTSNKVNFVGMPLPPWDTLEKYCKSNNLIYQNYGGTFNKNSKRNKSTEENMKLIQESIIAPSVQSQWQIDNGYIPCRIFKNISYGKMGLTNNPIVNELFDNKLIYSNDIEELVRMGLGFEKNPNKNKIIKELMENVRDNHTYVERMNFILKICNSD